MGRQSAAFEAVVFRADLALVRIIRVP